MTPTPPPPPRKPLDVSRYEGHTKGPWNWYVDGSGRQRLETIGRGRLIVMDFARKGMDGAKPLFAVWEGMRDGAPRERMGGILKDFTEDHPDARLIEASPALLSECIRQRDVIRALVEAHREIAIAPCITEMLGEEIEDGDICGCPGCRARLALLAAAAWGAE
jgi:hypothetical protein